MGGLRAFSGIRGVTVTSNFTGCIENLYFNDLNLLRDFSNEAKSVAANDTIGFYTGSIARYTFYGVTNLQCTMSDSTLEYPITFQTGQDFIVYDYKDSTELTLQFEFRTFQTLGTMIWAQLTSGQGACLYCIPLRSYTSQFHLLSRVVLCFCVSTMHYWLP